MSQSSQQLQPQHSEQYSQPDQYGQSDQYGESGLYGQSGQSGQYGHSGQTGGQQAARSGSGQQQMGGQQQLANQQRPGGRQGAGQLYPTRNTLDEQTRTTSVSALNQALADAVVLHSQLKSAHWNVKGPTFYQLHELFDDVADVLADHVDDIAERVTALGGIAAGTTRAAAQNATIPTLPLNADAATLLDQVATNVSAYDATLYRQITTLSEQGDVDTTDLLNEISRDVSKSLWFVEAHLQRGGGAAGAGQQSIQQNQRQLQGEQAMQSAQPIQSGQRAQAAQGAQAGQGVQAAQGAYAGQGVQAAQGAYAGQGVQAAQGVRQGPQSQRQQYGPQSQQPTQVQ